MKKSIHNSNFQVTISVENLDFFKSNCKVLIENMTPIPINVMLFLTAYQREKIQLARVFLRHIEKVQT